ncbi:MAG TPA: helix-turn-helix transcriptional regulator [Pseudonocardia sp.]
MGEEPFPAEIGARVRQIRMQRGLTLAVVAGLAGIDKTYLSRLERGERFFLRRGLVEVLAEALGCAVSDLTGQPYPAVDRASAEALAALPPISRVLADATLDNGVPDVPTRPLGQLARLVAEANGAAADSRYTIAGRDLAQLLLELHVHAVTGRDGETRRGALAALAEGCLVAVGSARSLGNLDLATRVAERAQEAAARLENPALRGFTAMSAAVVLTRVKADFRAGQVNDTALAELERADPGAADTAPAEAVGMLHLVRAQRAAKARDADTAATHLAEARALAARTGERRTLRFDFGPANVAAWDMAIEVERGRGTKRAAALARRRDLFASLPSADRRSALFFDIARGFAQDGGAHDAEALYHLDLADRAAPQRIRNDAIARELIAELEGRARHRVWELTSLKARITGPVSTANG